MHTHRFNLINFEFCFQFQNNKMLLMPESHQLLAIGAETMSAHQDQSVQQVRNYRQHQPMHGQHNRTKTLIDWLHCIEIEAVWVHSALVLFFIFLLLTTNRKRDVNGKSLFSFLFFFFLHSCVPIQWQACIRALVMDDMVRLL